MHALLPLALIAMASPSYPWLDAPPSSEHALHARIPAPAGFTRVAVGEGSYEDWLRHLPLAPKSTPVTTYNGRVRTDAQAVAVVDLDIGAKDLQQCADSIIRLRAEYLYSIGRADDVAFHFTNGHLAPYQKWKRGLRPRVRRGTPVQWRKRSEPADTHESFRGYLDMIYGWAGTASLDERTPRADRRTLRAGDFFVLGGFPGHAVVILDVARDESGRTALLIGQGFMPAQSFHVVAAPDGSPWFVVDAKSRSIEVPDWGTPFPWSSLRRFPDPDPDPAR